MAGYLCRGTDIFNCHCSVRLAAELRENKMMNIYQRINEVRKKIDYIKKDRVVQNYKAVTHDQVTAMVRDHLVAFGVVIYPNLISTITVDTGEKTSKGTPIIRIEAVYEFVFVNMDDSNDKFTVSVSAHAIDQGDKAPGKALSYAKKAVVLKVFEIETGEDDESRYESTPTGLSDSQIADHIAAIESAADTDALKAAYLKAQSAAQDAKDNAAFRKFKDVTNSAKAKFVKEAE